MLRACLVVMASCQFEPAPVGSADGGGAPDATDGAPTVDGLLDAGCAPTAAFTEDFSSPGLDSADERYGSGGCDREASGVLVLDPSSGGTCGRHWHRFSPFAFRDLRIVVEVAETMDPASQGESYMALFGSPCDPACDPSTWIVLREVAGMMQVQLGSGRTDVADYDPATHRWWQLREADGLLAYEVSTDGLTFTPLSIAETPPFADSVFLNLGASAPSSGPDPGQTRYDNLNLPPCR